MNDLSDVDVERLFRVDGAGPAPPIDPAAADAMINSALDAVLGPVPGPTGGGGGATTTAASSGKAAWWAALGAIVAGGAVAAFLLTRDPASTPAPEPTPPPMPSLSPDALPPPAPEPLPEPDEIEIVDDIEVLPAPAGPSRDSSPPKRDRPAPDDLMKQANAARRQKDWKGADALYARVYADYAGTAAAQVALVASATIQLEHLGNPRGAVARFKKALRGGGGGVAEEARYGLAEAYHALGDRVGEARALDDFLAHHADSPLADRARDRRKALGD